MGWQPIETVPKDGTVVLGWHKVWKCCVSIKWEFEGDSLPWIEATLSHWWPEAAFTHWMPLPSPPETDV